MADAHGSAHGADGAGASRPPLVFVSYSREDVEWRRRFVVMLEPEVRDRGIELWSDEQIRPAREWNVELEDAIERAAVALLLVTPDFLASAGSWHAGRCRPAAAGHAGCVVGGAGAGSSRGRA